MKLYIWKDPYKVNWGSSMCFAVADNLETAKEIAQGANLYRFVEYESGYMNLPLGEPTRVVDLPCAEWHEWSE